MSNEIVPFEFKSKEIRVVKDEIGDPWFVAKDVCEVLEHSNYRMAVENLDDDEKGVSKAYTLGGEQGMITVSESGLYTLIIRSNKPEAKMFRRWVTHEVLPVIRKTGTYTIPQGMALVSMHDLSRHAVIAQCREWILKSCSPFTMMSMKEAMAEQGFSCTIDRCREAIKLERMFMKVALLPREYRHSGRVPEYILAVLYEDYLLSVDPEDWEVE